MRTVVVLGAGASRAGGEVADRKNRLSCLPPLNADFFTHLQRITGAKHHWTVRSVIDDVVRLFGSNFSLTLEDYFTQLEFLIGAANIASRTPDLARSELLAKRDHLLKGLSAVLEESTNEIITRGGCGLHEALIESLGPGDAIISFNYDCLVDDALRRHGEAKWNARWGYSFRPESRVLGVEAWQPDRPSGRADSIRLLKLHGSINWQLPTSAAGSIVLKQRLHQQRGTPRFSIIPPVWNKAFDESQEGEVYRYIWQEAARLIRAAEAVVVIGFSFGATDLYAQSLFRVALQGRTKLRLLVLAVPSRATRHRIREVFDVPLAESPVIVRQYSGFTDLKEHLSTALGP